jgi:hypothetical protein
MKFKDMVDTSLKFGPTGYGEFCNLQFENLIPIVDCRFTKCDLQVQGADAMEMVGSAAWTIVYFGLQMRATTCSNDSNDSNSRVQSS